MYLICVVLHHGFPVGSPAVCDLFLMLQGTGIERQLRSPTRQVVSDEDLLILSLLVVCLKLGLFWLTRRPRRWLRYRSCSCSGGVNPSLLFVISSTFASVSSPCSASRIPSNRRFGRLVYCSSESLAFDSSCTSLSRLVILSSFTSTTRDTFECDFQSVNPPRQLFQSTHNLLIS